MSAVDWSQNQIRNWLVAILRNSLELGQSDASTYADKFIEEGYTEPKEDLAEMTRDDLKTDIGLTGKQAKTIIFHLQRVFTPGLQGPQDWDTNASNGNTVSSPPPTEMRKAKPKKLEKLDIVPEIKQNLTIIIMIGKGKKISIDDKKISGLSTETSVQRLVDFLKDDRGWTPGTYTLVLGETGKNKAAMDPSKVASQTLKSIGFRPGSNIIRKSFVVDGGAKESAAEIRVSDSTQCMIYLTGDDDFPRYRMHCGHVISNDGLYYLVTEQIKKDAYRIRCCSSGCNKEWSWDLCCEIARIRGDEKMKLEVRMAENEMNCDPNQRPCPFCHNYISRNPSTDMIRMRCRNCYSKYSKDFCWDCFGEWKTSGLTNCGNSGCGFERFNKQLRDAAKPGSTQRLLDKITVPGLRACPHCSDPVIVQHSGENCKHAKCVACMRWFCFICLRRDAKASRDETCGGPYEVCPKGLAAVQQF